jgi:hypothetical protein
MAECSIPGCGGRAFARSLCVKHYRRLRRRGDANATNRPGRPQSESLARLRGLFSEMSRRNEWRMLRAYRLSASLKAEGLVPEGEDVVRRAIELATRSNGSLNVAKMLDYVETRMAMAIALREGAA